MYNWELTGLKYCNAVAARNTLTSAPNSWVISGDTGDCVELSTTALSPFSSCSGSPSAAQSYTISGINLTANIVITAPTHFEVSVTSPTVGFANSQTLIQSGGVVNNTTVYIRQKSTASNNASGTITHSSTGMLTKNVNIPTSSVVSPNITPTVTINPTTALSGSQIFTATANNVGGGTVSYDFRIGASSQQNSASATWSATGLV